MSLLFYCDHPIEQRQKDGYVNGTAMCQANNVLIGHWLYLKQTKSYIAQLSIEIAIPISKLTEVRKGGDSTNQGTWLHPLLALNLGRWISPKFAIWCDRHIKVLIETGETSLNESNQKSRLDKIEQTLEELKRLIQEQAAIASLPPTPKTPLQKIQEILIELKGDLSTSEFSRQIEIHPASLRMYLGGKVMPGLERLAAIAKFKEITMDELLSFLYEES